VFAVGTAAFQVDDVGATAVRAPQPTHDGLHASAGASTCTAEVDELRRVVDEAMVGPSTSLIAPETSCTQRRTLIADAIDDEEGAMRDEDLRLAAMVMTKLGLGISA
jgi:hypothetical protein